MKLAGQKVLVIGGAGFIGSHVVDALLGTDAAEIVVFDNFSRGSRFNLHASLADPRCRVYRHCGDIRETDVLDDAMRGVDAVVHLAGMWLLHCLDFPRTAFEVNVAGTFNVLEACIRNGVKRLVYSSSASVYGDALYTPMDEDHPFNNRNLYGSTKISGESMCRAFYTQYGLSYVGLRYMNVYGPRQDQYAAYTGVIPNLLNAIDKGESPKINGDGSQSYDFVYVSDVARANVLALESDVDDAFYNIGTGFSTSIADLVERILYLGSSSLKPRYISYSEKDSRQLVHKRVGAVVRARDELGFEAQVELSEGIRRLMAWRSSLTPKT